MSGLYSDTDYIIFIPTVGVFPEDTFVGNTEQCYEFAKKMIDKGLDIRIKKKMPGQVTKEEYFNKYPSIDISELIEKCVNCGNMGFYGSKRLIFRNGEFVRPFTYICNKCLL